MSTSTTNSTEQSVTMMPQSTAAVVRGVHFNDDNLTTVYEVERYCDIVGHEDDDNTSTDMYLKSKLWYTDRDYKMIQANASMELAWIVQAYSFRPNVESNDLVEALRGMEQFIDGSDKSHVTKNAIQSLLWKQELVKEEQDVLDASSTYSSSPSWLSAQSLVERCPVYHRVSQESAKRAQVYGHVDQLAVQDYLSTTEQEMLLQQSLLTTDDGRSRSSSFSSIASGSSIPLLRRLSSFGSSSDTSYSTLISLDEEFEKNHRHCPATEYGYGYDEEDDDVSVLSDFGSSSPPTYAKKIKTMNSSRNSFTDKVGAFFLQKQ